MSSEAVEIISNTSPWVIFLIIFGLLSIILQCINMLKNLRDAFGIELKEDVEKREIKDSIINLSTELKKSISSLNSEIKDLREQYNGFQKEIDNITVATREELGDKINLKFKRYFELGYIPADEFDEFVSLHNAYNIVGGNHTGDAKYNKCIQCLKVIDDSKPETKIDLTNGGI